MSYIAAMNTAILTYKNPSLTPEARWLLMQWASVFGFDQSVVCSLQTLFKRLSLTYAQGRRAWDVLIGKHAERQKQFVEIERLPSADRGRPRSRYRLSAKLVKSLQMSPSASEHHAEEIATLAKTTLLSAENRAKNLVRDGRLRGYRLTLSNRWLLMVLLAHADTPGVITRLGISKIRHLTGMSRSRIDRQLKKLGDLGLIAHRQPGRYSSQASARKTSIYLLDLAHPLLGSFTRTPLTIVSPPSTKKPRQTELVDGIVDAVMTAGVCSLQIKALLEEYDSSKAPENIAADGTMQESKPEHDPYCEAKNYQEKYNKLKGVLNHALALLPGTRYLDGGIAELLKGYDAKDVDWLLTSVHIDTSRLLTSAWNDLKEGLLGPEQPSHDVIVATARRLGIKPEYVIKTESEQESEPAPEEADDYSNTLDNKKPHRPPEVAPITEQIFYPPLALLFYALSHHLAKRLQSALNPNEHEDVEAMTYMLVSVFPKPPNGQMLPAFQLRSYGLRSEDIDKEPTTIVFRSPVNEDLKNYWQEHHKDCLLAISDELGDSTPDFQEFTDQ